MCEGPFPDVAVQFICSGSFAKIIFLNKNDVSPYNGLYYHNR